MPGPKQPSLDRRGFIKRAAIGAAGGASALVTSLPGTEAQGQPAGQAPAQPDAASRVRSGARADTPTAEQLARETGAAAPPAIPPRTVVRPGSDLIVDTLRSVEIEFVMANPGSSFEGLHESIVNHGKDDIEFITALHEESSVAAAHGYAKATGKPMAALLHGTVGIMHAAMAIYNAYCDKAPVLLIAGLDFDGPVAAHNATDLGALVRGYTKWDTQPRTLTEAIGAIQRAYQIAITPPMAPVMVTLSGDLQKEDTAGRAVSVPPFRPPPIPSADYAATRRIAKALVEAQNPRINAARLRTPEGVRLVVELVELVGAQVGSSAAAGPMSFPMSHPLRGNGVAGTPVDFTLNLEAAPFVPLLNPPVASAARAAGGATPGALVSATMQSPALLTTNFSSVAGATAGNAPGDLLIEARRI